MSKSKDKGSNSLVEASNVLGMVEIGDSDYIARGDTGADFGVQDIQIPRIELVQALSPVRKSSRPEYIEGAEEGMLYNTVSRQLYGDSVLVVPLRFFNQYILWMPRQGGSDSDGFRGSFPTAAEAEAARASNPEAEGADIVITPTYVVAVLDETGEYTLATLSMPVTKRKVSRTWNTLIANARVPMWGRVYKISSVEETGPKGDYLNFKVQMVGAPSRDLYDRLSVERGAAEAVSASLLASRTGPVEDFSTNEVPVNDGNEEF